MSGHHSSGIRSFASRHIGPNPSEVESMLGTLGLSSLDGLIEKTVPQAIRLKAPLDLPPALSEEEALKSLKTIASANSIQRSYIGMGYYGTHTPTVILRNILENPGWYTAYTPYQAEIAQGRLEALINFQTMVCDLTGMEIANSSLLDESTAAAEAMVMCRDIQAKGDSFFVADDCHPQTISLIRTRAEPLGIRITVDSVENFKPEAGAFFGALFQYPCTYGFVRDLQPVIEAAKKVEIPTVVATDLLALTLLKPPGEMGAEIVVGSSQRFGVPMGYGGPHAAFLATRDAHKRRMPGRLVGVSRDAKGKPGYRLTLQTREQHIRREKATSNICTAQVLLAVIASMYAVYHGREGLTAIARTLHKQTSSLAKTLAKAGLRLRHQSFFDTLYLEVSAAESDAILARAGEKQINLRQVGGKAIGFSLDETVTCKDLQDLAWVFTGKETAIIEEDADALGGLNRKSDFFTHPVFSRFHTETELLRYIHRLQSKDLSLTTSMIPLGSCTMKLNATSEMIPVTWAEFGNLHPFAPLDQTKGYQKMFSQLEQWLAEITGFSAVSLQPNAGSQGEYAGLLVIRRYHQVQGNGNRTICLIPTSAHGTNPASAVMAGFEVVPVSCDENGNIDMTDFRAKVEKHSKDLGALMVTYPSTHGVFEETIIEICELVHKHGGQVYMDGANMNAQVGLCSPGGIGADVCHLNLHKTFCIPHGGGGPGMGPICVAEHLASFLPGHSVISVGHEKAIGEISEAPWGSASILVISWMYIAMMGGNGLTDATKIAILNANYIAKRLEKFFPTLYKGRGNHVAHECILDFRAWKQRAGIEVEDIAKRLIDYGFHAPTMSWPVPGTLMVEPTESESKAELDRFCDAMIAIHGELVAVEKGELDSKDNPLKNAPHPADTIASDEWTHPYSRQQATYPAAWLSEHKYWPPVSRIDNVYGDRNIYCSCVPMEEFSKPV
ncbi:MAG: aminomethyl-transferring glycine dehydrogenase [Chthoniobacterales bacterium]